MVILFLTFCFYVPLSLGILPSIRYTNLTLIKLKVDVISYSSLKINLPILPKQVHISSGLVINPNAANLFL